MDFREKVLQRTNSKSGYKSYSANENGIAEVTSDSESLIRSDFFNVENIRNPVNSLDLRFADGTSRGMPYSFITEFAFNPSEGIEIQTINKKIIIEGRNLTLLYNYLLAYRVKFIQMNIGNDLVDDKSLFVKRILIEDL